MFSPSMFVSGLTGARNQARQSSHLSLAYHAMHTPAVRELHHRRGVGPRVAAAIQVEGRHWVDLLASVSSRTLSAADSTITERKLDVERNAAVMRTVGGSVSPPRHWRTSTESTTEPKHCELTAVSTGGPTSDPEATYRTCPRRTRFVQQQRMQRNNVGNAFDAAVGEREPHRSRHCARSRPLTMILASSES